MRASLIRTQENDHICHVIGMFIGFHTRQRSVRSARRASGRKHKDEPSKQDLKWENKLTNRLFYRHFVNKLLTNKVY